MEICRKHQIDGVSRQVNGDAHQWTNAYRLFLIKASNVVTKLVT